MPANRLYVFLNPKNEAEDFHATNSPPGLEVEWTPMFTQPPDGLTHIPPASADADSPAGFSARYRFLETQHHVNGPIDLFRRGPWKRPDPVSEGA